MALSATGILEVRTGGSDANNGGGFNPGNTSMATDLTTDANTANTSSPVVSSASYNFAARDVGHYLFVKSGTNWTPGWYPIASVASNKATLDASVGAAVLYQNSRPGTLNTSAGCATVGTPTGGTWSIDYSQANSGVAYTDMVQASTTTLTSAGNPFGKNFVGNYLRITGGTGTWTNGVYEVTSVTGTTATVDRSTGGTGGTAGTGGLGGALSSPGGAGAIHVASMDVYIKSGTYTLVSPATSNTSNGIVSFVAGSATNHSRIEGYSSYRGDQAARPVIKVPNDASVTSVTVVTYPGSCKLICIEVDGQSQTSIRGFFSSSIGSHAIKCKATNCTNNGFSTGTNNGQVYQQCMATGCSGTNGAFSTNLVAIYIDCEAWGNSVSGFLVTGNGAVYLRCISSGNSGGSSDGFEVTGGYMMATNCVSYGNGRAGYTLLGTCVLENCIAEANSGEGYRTAAVVEAGYLSACGGYNNSSGNYTSANLLPTQVVGFVANTTGTFFTNAASGDFSLNNTTNQGALARATGYPGLMPRGLTTGYIDIGVAQHQDTGGGGGPCFNRGRPFV